MKIKQITMSLCLTLFVALGYAAQPYVAKGNMWEIYTADGLVAFQKAVDANPKLNAKLMADIDLGTIANFTPIGDEKVRYFGKFDGNNKSIKNLTILNKELIKGKPLGLFGNIGGNGQVSNLTLVDVNITSKSVKTAALAGIASGVIINCHVVGGKVESTADVVGGIVGIGSPKIIGCSNSASITGKTFVGGIIGSANAGVVLACSNSGAVKSIALSSAKEASVGGIIGIIRIATNPSFPWKGCIGSFNVGDVVAKNPNGVGGAIGSITPAPTAGYEVATYSVDKTAPTSTLASSVSLATLNKKGVVAINKAIEEYNSAAGTNYPYRAISSGKSSIPTFE